MGTVNKKTSGKLFGWAGGNHYERRKITNTSKRKLWPSDIRIRGIHIFFYIASGFSFI